MPDAETLRALLAGLIAGAVVAFAVTAVGMIAIARDRRWLGRAPNLRLPLPLLGVVLVNGLMLGCTALGLALGALYLRAEATHPAGGLASPNRLFTLLVVGAVLVVAAGAGYVRGRVTRPLWLTALIVVLAYGWLLPALAR